MSLHNFSLPHFLYSSIYIYCFEFAYISSVMTDEISFMMKLYACCQNGYKSCIAAKWFSVRRYSVKSSASFLVDTFGWYLKAKILMTGFKGDWDNDTAPSWHPWKFANRYFSYACRMVMSFWGACGGVEEDEVVKKERSCERILSYLYGIVECCGIYKSILQEAPHIACWNSYVGSFFASCLC